MLSALDEKGQLVSVLDGIPDKQAFRCPACYAALHLKNGMVLRPHFAMCLWSNATFTMKMKVANTCS